MSFFIYFGGCLFAKVELMIKSLNLDFYHSVKNGAGEGVESEMKGSRNALIDDINHHSLNLQSLKGNLSQVCSL